MFLFQWWDMWSLATPPILCRLDTSPVPSVKSQPTDELPAEHPRIVGQKWNIHTGISHLDEGSTKNNSLKLGFACLMLGQNNKILPTWWFNGDESHGIESVKNHQTIKSCPCNPFDFLGFSRGLTILHASSWMAGAVLKKTGVVGGFLA